MARRNGKSEVETAAMDAKRELSASDDINENIGKVESSGDRVTVLQPESELQKVTAERDTLLDRLARAQAEFDNARKRAAREQQDYRDYAQSDTIKALLPIMDSFERALQANLSEEESSEKSEFRNGIELIYKQLQDALFKLGVRPIAAKGRPFDPRLHEAIEMVDTAETDDQHVLEELQRGYKLKERLLRPAMVKVARNPRSS
jgi:molecular chaperone GrpE